MLCVQLDTSNFVQVISPQPADITTCTMVIVAPTEVKSPFDLSVDDALTISYAVIPVFLAAFAWRMVIRALNADSSPPADTA